MITNARRRPLVTDGVQGIVDQLRGKISLLNNQISGRRATRAAAVAVAIIQIIETAPRRQRQQRVEQYLHDEFEDERRQAIAGRELADA